MTGQTLLRAIEGEIDRRAVAAIKDIGQEIILPEEDETVREEKEVSV